MTWAPVCCICLMAIGHRLDAHTLIEGDAVCVDHASLRVHAGSLRKAIDVAREDVGERPHRWLGR